jgi:hypothetical protein
VFANIFKLGATGAQGQQSNVQMNVVPQSVTSNTNTSGEKIGRNDPCPCHSGKKWKKCGMLNTEEHQRNIATGGPKHEVVGG